MRAPAALGLTLVILGAAGVVIERPRSVSAPPAAPIVRGASALEPEAGSDGVEGLSQSALEERLDRLEHELSAGSSSFPSSGRVSAEPTGSSFGLD